MNTQVIQGQAPQDKTAFYIYILYIAGFFVPPAALIGLVMAYVNKGKDAVLDSHYAKQIRTFWIGLAVCILGWVLAIFVVGYFILLAWFVWTILVCVKGLKAFNEGLPV